jgi:hypothetical protein
MVNVAWFTGVADGLDRGELYAEAVRHFLRKEVPERWQKGLDECSPDQVFAKFVVDAHP